MIKSNVNLTYFPVNIDMLEDPRLTPAQFKILCTFCRYYNPLLRFNKQSLKPVTSEMIAELSKLNVSTVKHNVKALVKLRPQNFEKVTKQFGTGIIYQFKMEISKQETIAVEVETDVINSYEKPIGNTKFSAEDLDKMKILELTGFHASELQQFLRYSKTEIKLRVGYILKQKKARQLHPEKFTGPRRNIGLNYLKQCFEEQWHFKELEKLDVKEIISEVDQRLSPLLDQVVNHMKFAS